MRSATFRAHLEHIIKTDVRTWYICMYINPYQYLYVQTDTRVHIESYIYTRFNGRQFRALLQGRRTCEGLA